MNERTNSQISVAETVSLRELLMETTTRFRGGGIDGAEREARWILEEVTGLSASEFVLAASQFATVGHVARLDQLVARRLAGEPIQYVMGHWPFRSLDLMVDPRVLIPRPETEQLVDLALAEADRALGSNPGRAADLGTGSGAIALALAVERPNLRVTATDQSEDALACARANCAGVGRPATRVSLRQGSWYDALESSERHSFDLLVSNPPYIPSTDVVTRSVVEWEPEEALFAGPLGITDLEVLIVGATNWLRPSGSLCLELDPRQANWARDLALNSGFAEAEVVLDLAGQQRFVIARRG